MERIAVSLITVALVGCTTASGPRAHTERARTKWQQMEERDARLRAQFKKIKIGMSPTEVRNIMGIDPEVKRDDLWGFTLSHASNTSEETDWTLLVGFENGKVRTTETTYTCLHIMLRE